GRYAGKQGTTGSMVHIIPADLGHAQRGILGLEPNHVGFEPAEALILTAFEAAAAEHLKAEADRQERLPLANDLFVQRRLEALTAQAVNAIAKRADSRQDDPFCFA